MATLDEARQILAELGMPKQQHNKLAGLTLMALARVSESVPWSEATARSWTIRKGLMDYCDEVLGYTYAENSREHFRRKALHQFIQAGICLENPDDGELSTNSGNSHYSLTPEVLAVVKTFGTPAWEMALSSFISIAGTLVQRYSAARDLKKVPLLLADGRSYLLSPGQHNEVQAEIIQEFAPRFAPGATLLYLGDTRKKALIFEKERLKDIGLTLTSHDKLPDVLLLDTRRNWLFLVEAVTSHGPMSPKRLLELHPLLKGCTAGPVFVSAFRNMAEFKKHAANIAWDTEVWLSEVPDHMMHFNGDRFLGPRNSHQPDLESDRD